MQALQLRDTFWMGLYFVVVGRVHRWLWLLLCLLHDDGIVISMMLLIIRQVIIILLLFVNGFGQE